MAFNRFFYLPTKTPVLPYDFSNKVRSVENHVTYMLDRTVQMFKYQNLPDTIPAHIIELMTQSNGVCIFFEYSGNYYVAVGGWGGRPDEYYIPTEYTIANPALNVQQTFKIGEDCELYGNDSLYAGLLPMLRKYATLMTEAELSMKMAIVVNRANVAITAPDNQSKIFADDFIRNLEEGKYTSVRDNAFLDGIKSIQLGSGAQNALTQLIEIEQYAKASLFNELGLNANYNMKRESINSGEAQLNGDSLTPFIDDMLATRRRCLEKINEHYGLNIQVDLNSAWLDNEIELALEQRSIVDESVSEDELIEEQSVDVESETSDDSNEEDEKEIVDDVEEQPELVDVIEDVADAIEELVDAIEGDENEEEGL